MSRIFSVALAAVVLAGCGKTKSPADADKSPADGKTPPGKTAGNVSANGKSTTPKTRTKKLKPYTPPAEVKLTPVTPAELKKFIADQKGHAVFVDYWGVYCPPCRREFPHTVEYSRKYAKDGLVVVSVCIDAATEKESAIEFLKKQKAQIVNFGSQVEDIEMSLDAFEIEMASIPRYRVYNAEGELVLNVPGGKEEEIESAITKALGYE